MKKIAKLCAVTLAAILAFLPMTDVYATGDVIVEVPGGPASDSSDPPDPVNALSPSPASAGTQSGPVEGGVSTMNKTAVPIGDSADRTYRVDLTVGGDESIDAHYGNVYILADLPFLMGANQVSAYYLRAIWNMCDTIRSEQPNAKFCLIAYSDKIYIKSDWIASDQLGDPNLIYTQFETGQLHRYYQKPSTYQQGTLLAELDRLTPYSTIGNLPEGTKYNDGRADSTGMYIHDDEALNFVGTSRGEFGQSGYNHAVNTELALKAVRDDIAQNGRLNNHVVMVSSTPPTASSGTGDTYTGGSQNGMQTALNDALEVYYEMADAGKTNFYMFGYGPFVAQQEGYTHFFENYVNTIGGNKQSDGSTRFTAEELQKMLVNIGWDHQLGIAADYEQKLNARVELNEGMGKVGSCVSEMFTTRQEYAYNAAITDTVPEEFEIVPGSIRAAVGDEAASGAAVSGNTVTWAIGDMKADAGQYKLSYEVRAKDSYFGGEVRATNTEASLNYTNASGASKQDLFPVPAVYVPWKASLTGSEHSYFYGNTPDTDAPDSLTVPAQNTAKVNSDYYAFDLKDANGATGGQLADFQFEWQAAGGSPLVEQLPGGGSVVGKVTSGQVERLLYYCRPGGADFRLQITNPKLAGFTALQGLLQNTAPAEEYVAWLGGETSAQLSAYQETANVKFTVQSGSLTLSKTVINALAYTPDRVEGKKFIMQVRGPMSFDVELEHNKSFTLTGLKAGEYTVTEVVPQNYELDGMEKNGASVGKTAAFTVSKTAPDHSVKVKNKLTNIEYFYQDIEITNKCVTVDFANN